MKPVESTIRCQLGERGIRNCLARKSSYRDNKEVDPVDMEDRIRTIIAGQLCPHGQLGRWAGIPERREVTQRVI
jgi:hypothetical protein